MSAQIESGHMFVGQVSVPRFETSTAVDRAIAVVIVVVVLMMAHLFGLDSSIVRAVYTSIG
jgi:hypothetical protein